MVCLNDKRQLYLEMVNYGDENDGSVNSQENVRINNPWDYDPHLWNRLTTDGQFEWFLSCSFADNRENLSGNQLYGTWGNMRDYSRSQDGYRIGINIWTLRGSVGVWPQFPELETRIDHRIAQWESTDKLINDVHVTKDDGRFGSIHKYGDQAIEIPTAYGDGHLELIPISEMEMVHSINNNNSDWYWW